MEFPAELRLKLEQLFNGRDIGKMTAASEELSLRYRSEGGSGRSLVKEEREVLAYAAVRMPATFGAVCRALELTLARWDGGISSVLDIGAGTGAACHAAQLLTECTHITCIEREERMISPGRELTEARGISAEWIRADISAGLSYHADLVIASYCLNELSPEAWRTALIGLWSSADRLLLLVEPGTPQGFSRIKQARELLVAEGGYIAAPCPHSSECPLPENDWCHFTARIARSKLHKQLKGGDAPYEDEKFCFLAVSKEPCHGAASRILRHPRIESGRITLRLCTERGISDRLVTRKSPLFKAARKSDSGDTFPEE